jgi:cobalamin biosynthesis protein CobW
LGGALEKKILESRIEKVLANHDVLRLKGFANVEGSAARLLIQAVGPRLDSYFDRPWKKDEPRGTNLVVIAMKGIDKTAIEAALKG